MSRSPESGHGFTLVELLIAIAIVALLATIAYPTFLNQVRESRRTEAKALILRVANRQERLYATATPNSYGDSMGDLGWGEDADGNEINSVTTEDGWYDVSVVNGNANGFLIRALARNDQENDDCVRMEVNNLGQRRAFDADSGGNDVSDECW